MSKCSAYFSLNNIDGKHDVKEIKKEIGTIHGVLSVSVNDNSDRVAVDYDTTGVDAGRLVNKIQKLGYSIVDIKTENHIM